MAWTQLVKPNLKQTGNVGWCLKFVEDSYNTPHSYATATDAWKGARKPHYNAPPKDAMVPVYWPYTEDGLDFGHIAISVPGKGILSSPYKQNNSQQWFASLEECQQVLGLGKYRGWSEDLEGVSLVKKEDDMYKGKSAKEWYKLYIRKNTLLNRFIKLAKSIIK